MQSILVSEPVMAYPRRNHPYALITDASLGDSNQKKRGGLGAILTQIDEHGEHQVIAYASRKLVQHEKNYMPYLLEMQAAIWAMEHFDFEIVYKKGSEMPADFLSRNLVVDSISFDEDRIRDEQMLDRL